MFKIFGNIIFILIISLVSSCPPAEKLHPCTCERSFQITVVTCQHLLNDEALLDVVYNLKDMKFYSFVIENGNFINIPHDIFDGIKFQVLGIAFSSFMALTDTDVAFEGLDDDLESLEIAECDILNEWDWSVLKNLKKLTKIAVDVNLDIIADNIKELVAPDLTVFNLNNNEITYIYEKAFANFNKLSFLSLKHNLISEFKRSMLPDPAPLLKTLDLSYNKIEQLPSNMFENLPKLEYVDLVSNLILTMNKNTFSNILRQLRGLDMTDNHLRCDCRLTWILKMGLSESIKAFCDRPLSLNGKSLSDLTEGDLRC